MTTSTGGNAATIKTSDSWQTPPELRDHDRADDSMVRIEAYRAHTDRINVVHNIIRRALVRPIVIAIVVAGAVTLAWIRA